MALPPRLPPRGNATPSPSAADVMPYADRQRGRTALTALAPAAGETLSEFTDRWINSMRDAGFPAAEIAAAKLVAVRLCDLGAELPATTSKPAVPLMRPQTRSFAQRDPTPIAAELMPSDEVDPDYEAHTASAPEPVDPYDDEHDAVVEPPEMPAPPPVVVAPTPPAATAQAPVVKPSAASVMSGPKPPRNRVKPKFSMDDD